MLNTPAPDSEDTSVAAPIARLFFIDAAAQIVFFPEQGSLIISLASGVLARWNHPFAMPSIVILGVVRLVWISFLIWLALAFGPLPLSILIITFIQRTMIYVGVLALVFVSSTPLMARWVTPVLAIYPLGYIILLFMPLFGL